MGQYEKIKLTRQQTAATNEPILKIGYCDLSALLTGISAWGYNCGVYGWNYDVYDITSTKTGEGVRITTGYRNMIGERLDYKIIRKYEDKAKAITGDWNISYESKQKKLTTLRNRFIDEVYKILER